MVFEASFGEEPRGTRAVGKAAARQLIENLIERVPDVRWDEIRHFVCPEHATVELVTTGTRRARLVVVVSLREQTFHDHAYRLGFPLPGTWREALNSDLYDHFPNRWVHGNGGGVVADRPSMHGLPHSAALTIPANSILIFTRGPGY